MDSKTRQDSDTAQLMFNIATNPHTAPSRFNREVPPMLDLIVDRREMKAAVIAGVPAVAAFYRRELGARNWKEEAASPAPAPDQLVLNFSSAEEAATLTLMPQYDVTISDLNVRVKEAVLAARIVPSSWMESIRRMRIMSKFAASPSAFPSGPRRIRPTGYHRCTPFRVWWITAGPPLQPLILNPRQ